MAKIKRLGVIKTASFMGLYMFAFGIIFILLWGIILSTLLGPLSGFVSTGASLSSLILVPIIYGVIGFIGGLILTPIMNLALRIIKGVDLDIEFDDSNSYSQESQFHQSSPPSNSMQHFQQAQNFQQQSRY